MLNSGSIFQYDKIKNQINLNKVQQIQIQVLKLYIFNV